MTPERRQELTLLRRARDHMDRRFAEPLDVAAVATVACMSPAHFSRRFHAAYGESPHAYLMTRRIERACALLRGGSSVTDACLEVGFTSLGSFSARFRQVVGVPPTAYAAEAHGGLAALDACTVRAGTRPSRIREAAAPPAA